MRNSHQDSVVVFLDADYLPEKMKIGILSHDRGQYFFEYDTTWLNSDYKFNIDQNLSLTAKPQAATSRTFKIFLDSAPDRWGRVLMDKRELVEAIDNKRIPRPLRDWDYLLGVQDQTRMGAIRLMDAQGAFIDNRELAAPPVTSLAELQYIAGELERSDATDLPELRKWLASLLAPGTSLGGARPKANFTDKDGTLWIAKFPSQNDKNDTGLWELILNELASKAKIEVPKARAIKFSGNYHTFCVERFDRRDAKRRMFTSAMTMLNKTDGETASYIEIAEFIFDEGAPGIDNQLEELWRRMVFNIMVSNRDDHLRNHGFLRTREGWRLAPVYDVNPTLDKHEHALALNLSSNIPSLDAAFEDLGFFRMTYERAVEITEEVRSAVLQWKVTAQKHLLSQQAILQMSPAFELASQKIPEDKQSKNKRRKKE